MYKKKIYIFACVYRIFSRFIQTETQFIHLFSVCISERSEGGEQDLGEWRARFVRRERGERKYMYIYNFVSLYTNKKRERRKRERECRARFNRRDKIAIVCYTIKLNYDYTI